MRKLLFLSLVIIVFGFVGVFVVGGNFVEPHQRSVGEPPSDLPFETVLIQRGDGKRVAGWFAPGDDDKAGILLLHGIRSDRRGMLGRARFLHDAGYSVLLVDMQAHGETPGEFITFGYRESRDVRAALDYLAARLKGRPIGIVGASMGGAATLLGGSPADADAVILEGVYSSIEDAVGNRIAIRLGEIGYWLAPLLLWQIEPRLGVSLESLAPISAIDGLEAPVMIIGGSEDQRTSVQETHALFARARSPKQLWLVKGAKHQDFHRYSEQAYEKRVLLFFDQHLEQRVK